MNHTISEWQNLSLKKDIEKLVMKQDQKEAKNLVIVVDVTLAAISILAESFFSSLGDSPTATGFKYGCYFVIFLFIVAITGWYCWGFYSESERKKKAVEDNRLSTQIDADIFDNKICYCAMTASTFYDALTSIANSNQEEHTFYYIETHYYINKCILELEQIDNQYDYLFTHDTKEVRDGNRIHATRLENIVDLIRTIRINLYSQTQNSTSKKLIATNELAHEYDQLMTEFIKDYNKTSLNQLVWIKY